MSKGAKRKSPRRLYFSAKISDYQFKKVLWHFTLDHSAAETAKHIRLSENSITAIFAKLRKFFCECGLFNDPYIEGDPDKGLTGGGSPELEQLIILYHFHRASQKRGTIFSPLGEPDYHLAESNWRLDFLSLRTLRDDVVVDRKMYAVLLLFVRQFGPVGAKDRPAPEDRLAGMTLALEMTHDDMRWKRRIAPKAKV